MRGDVSGAYLTSKLSGPATYLLLGTLKNLPADWVKRCEGIVEPCVRLEQSIYGLERGDTDWG